MVKDKEVTKQKSDVETLLTEIKEKTTIANKSQKEANSKKKQLDIDNVQI